MAKMICLVAVLLVVDSLHFVFARLLLPHIAPSIAVFYVIAIGTVDVTISRSLFYLVLRRMKMSIHSIVLTLSPVVAVLWSLYLFNTAPSVIQLMGGIVVLIGVLIVNLKKTLQIQHMPTEVRDRSVCLSAIKFGFRQPEELICWNLIRKSVQTQLWGGFIQEISIIIIFKSLRSVTCGRSKESIISVLPLKI